MELTFSLEELVSFGNYLLSDIRELAYINHPEYKDNELLKERLSIVNDADIQNWQAYRRHELQREREINSAN